MRRTLDEIHDTAGPIAIYVRQKRRELGYTQQTLAQRVGVGIRFLKELELGKESLRLDKVNQVVRFLGGEVTVVEVRKA